LKEKLKQLLLYGIKKIDIKMYYVNLKKDELEYSYNVVKEKVFKRILNKLIEFNEWDFQMNEIEYPVTFEINAEDCHLSVLGDVVIEKSREGIKLKNDKKNILKRFLLTEIPECNRNYMYKAINF